MDNLNSRYIPVRDRIFALLKEKSIQQKDFAKAVGVYESTVSNWNKGKSFSFVKRLDVIAQVLGTTENWLLNGDSPTQSDLAQGAKTTMDNQKKKIFVQNIKSYCEAKGVKPTVACRESGVGTSFINNIEKRNQIPSVEKVQMLAEYLGVTTSELLGEEKPTPGDGDWQRKSDNVVRIAGRDGSFYERELSDAQRELLVQMLDNFKSVDDENV